MATGNDVVELARSVIGEWYYSNKNPDRLDPRTYGVTDCSGTVRWAFAECAGLDVGTWTGDESTFGVEIARGYSPDDLPLDDMLPGDVILMTANAETGWLFDDYWCHIEIYCGNGTMVGSPGGYIPSEKWAIAWMQAYGCHHWMVRRYLEREDDMPSAQEIAEAVWNYGEPHMVANDVWNLDINGKPARERLFLDNVMLYGKDGSGKQAEDETGEHVDTGATVPARLAYMEAQIKEMNDKLDKFIEGK